jgi:hypothetical protein
VPKENVHRRRISHPLVARTQWMESQTPKKNKNDKRQVAKFKDFVTYYYLPLHILSSNRWMVFHMFRIKKTKL